MTYSVPLNIQPDGITDRTLDKIGSYLKERLNSEYPQTPDTPTIEVVKSVVTYPAFNVDLSQFPLLKVYRTSDSFKRGTTMRISRGVIEYCLSFPDVERFPGLFSWMSFNLNKLLLDSEQRFHVRTEESGRLVEYRMSMSELGLPVYAFLRMSFSFQD